MKTWGANKRLYDLERFPFGFFGRAIFSPFFVAYFVVISLTDSRPILAYNLVLRLPAPATALRGELRGAGAGINPPQIAPVLGCDPGGRSKLIGVTLDNHRGTLRVGEPIKIIRGPDVTNMVKLGQLCKGLLTLAQVVQRNHEKGQLETVNGFLVHKVRKRKSRLS